MNLLTIIGNLTRDPELRSTSSGVSVCDFSVAVNPRKRSENGPDAQFFKVTVWRELAQNCARFLFKGRKVCVVGPVELRTYQANDGTTKAYMEVTGQQVEFLSSKEEANDNPPAQKTDSATGFTAVETDELPF